MTPVKGGVLFGESTERWSHCLVWVTLASGPLGSCRANRLSWTAEEEQAQRVRQPLESYATPRTAPGHLVAGCPSSIRSERVGLM